jgi:hypothetical protein
MRSWAALSTTALIFAAGCGARTVLDLADYTNGPAADGGGSGGGSGSGSNGGSGGGSGGSSGGVSGSGSGGSGSSSGGLAPISCGAQSCDPTSQECCVTLGGPGAPPMESCGPKGQCMGDVTLNCTGSSSCPNNEVCCFSMRGGTPQTRCATRCRSGGGGFGGQLCSTDQDCPMGQQCMMTPLGFGVCFGGGGGGGGPGGGGGVGVGGGTGGNPGGSSSSGG